MLKSHRLYTSHTHIMSTCTCDVLYSPFLKCEERVFSASTGKNLCVFHVYQQRKSDDCAICLDGMCGDKQSVFLLQCGHMFHTECLRECIKPQCPVCRIQLKGDEAAMLFYPKVLRPICVKLYSLPLESIEYVLAMFDIVITVARVGTDATHRLFTRLMRLYGSLFV